MNILQPKGSRNPSLQDTITVGGVAQDLLTGVTGVAFSMRPRTSATLKVDHVAATIVQSGPTTNVGVVRYDWAAADVNGTVSGITAPVLDYVAWWTVTFTGGKTEDTPEFAVYLTDHVAGTSDLCSREDVKQGWEATGNTNKRDPQIDATITAVSAHVMRRLERELVPKSTGAVRTFRLDSYGLDLVPFDLRSASLVRLHPESGSPVTLTSGSDYALEPVQKPLGTYTKLHVAGLIPLVSTFATRFGYAQIEVTGDWGVWDLPTVPMDIRNAVAQTVRAWMSQPVSQMGLAQRPSADGSVIVEPPTVWGIPDGPWSVLKHLKRQPV